MRKNDLQNDILDMLGLTETSLELDLKYIIENGTEDYLAKLEEEKQKKADFVNMFRECYDDIIKVIQADSRQGIAVNCAGCRYANRVELGYGKAKTIRNNKQK